jgi:hypothetical protein
MLRRVAIVRTDVSEERKQHEQILVFLRNVLLLLVTVNIVHSLPILFNPMMEVIRSSETSAFTRARWGDIPEDAILDSHRRETSNLT